MAVIRKTLSEIAAGAPKADWGKVDAATDEDIDRMIAEDEDVGPDTTTLGESTSPQAIRKRLGMTQERFAQALRIPLATLRNWEQGRVEPDPAARSLLRIVAREPERALKALAD